MADATLTITISNGACVSHLMEAIAAFADMYEPDDYETQEGKNLRLALTDFAEQIKVCNCHGI